jgi:hypothetical protein
MDRPRSDLWRYLESHRTLPEMPDPAELRRRFGDPDEVSDVGNTVNPSIWGVTPGAVWYARYSDDERRQDWIETLDWAFHVDADGSRAIIVLLRKAGGPVLGWTWFEDVPVGEELGPPA